MSIKLHAPPRIIALILSVLVFAAYQTIWLPNLIELGPKPRFGPPVPTAIAIICCIILGYSLAMVTWLLRQTTGQLKATFRPTKARIVGMLVLAIIVPMSVASWTPMILGLAVVFLPFAIVEVPFPKLLSDFLFPLMSACLLAYPFASMIIRHTYQRWHLRICLFALAFWAMYAFHLLFFGNVRFSL